MITADNITDEQLLVLRREALDLGDADMMRLCDIARGYNIASSPTDAGADAYKNARARCAKYINLNARAASKDGAK